MARWLQILIGLPLCWLLLQSVHEFGHILAGLASGGTLRQVVLHPLELSRTEFLTNPHPLFVAWSGALFGSALPVLMWLLGMRFHEQSAVYLRFFAGFCLLGNGVYFIVGTLDPGADPGDVLRHGSSAVLNYVFGVVAASVGLALWNGLGPELGFGSNARFIPWNVPVLLALTLGLTVTLQVTLAPFAHPETEGSGRHGASGSS